MHNVKVQDENQLLKWLIDPYKSFILSKTVLQSKRKQTPKQYENHHIFPKHLGGLDTHWNLILLTIEEHTLAHFLCYQTYKNKKDLYVYLMRKKENPELRKILQKNIVNYLKQNQKCMFDPKWQSQQGKKGGKKRTRKRDLGNIKRQHFYIRSILEHGSIWRHKNGCFVLIKPKQYEFPKEIAKRLYNANLISMKTSFSNYFTQGVRAVCLGKQRFVNGWAIVGVLVQPVSKIPENIRKHAQFKNVFVDLYLRSRSYQLNVQLCYPTHWKHKPTGIELVILPLRNGSTIANLAHELQKAVVTEYIKPTTIKHLATVIKHQKIGSTRNNWVFLGTIIRSQDL